MLNLGLFLTGVILGTVIVFTVYFIFARPQKESVRFYKRMDKLRKRHEKTMRRWNKK